MNPINHHKKTISVKSLFYIIHNRGFSAIHFPGLQFRDLLIFKKAARLDKYFDQFETVF